MSRKKGTLFVVSGSSGSGKGTVLGELLNRSEKFCYSVSATTRAPREGETDGKNYFFVSRDRFEALIESGEMLEYAEYVGNLYGTPKSYVFSRLEQGMNVVLEIEIQGAKQIKAKIPESVLIFITPPNYEALSRRLYDRGTESAEVIEKRLEIALEEIKAAKEYDYIVVNEDGRAAEAAEDIIAISEGKYHRNSDAKKLIRDFIN